MNGRKRSRAFTLDLFVEGERVRRGTRGELVEGGLRFDDRTLPFQRIFWVSRRAGLLLLFSRNFTAALKGRGQDLEELARAAERCGDRAKRRRELLRPFAGEVVVCTAGTAITGTLGGARVGGLHLAVFTQRGLHLLSGTRCLTLSWPVERAQRVRPRAGKSDHESLLLRAPGTSLRLRYLFPEEVRAALRVAERPPADGAPASGSALELFARAEVAPPLSARLPELAVSVDTLRQAAERAGAAVPRGLRESAGLPDPFFELHLQELGEIALGPLMLRKSAAAGTESLRRALEVMDARALREDTEAAVGTAVERLSAAYAREAERARSEGSGRRRPPVGLRLGEGEREGLAGRVLEPVAKLAPLFARLETCQESLRTRLEAYETAPPDTADAEPETAAAEWRSALRRLDGAYAAAWEEMLEEVVRTWNSVLLPRLERARAERASGLPEWARIAGALAGLILLVVALVLLF